MKHKTKGINNVAIYNLGSINIDHVYTVERLPEAGETLSAKGSMVNLGGKGLNISVAALRSGACVHHVGVVGAGDKAVRTMISDLGLNDGLISDAITQTGHAIIYVDDHSENCIVIHGGANECFTYAQIKSALAEARTGDWLVLQNETNANEIGIDIAREKGMKIALVAAPFDAQTMPDQIAKVDLASMNKTETALFEAAVGTSLNDFDGPEFLITYGTEGAMFLSSDDEIHVSSHNVNARDTTGAGDIFFGVFLANYAAGAGAKTALRYANAAAALMVQRKGAATVAPTKAEIEAFLEE